MRSRYYSTGTAGLSFLLFPPSFSSVCLSLCSFVCPHLPAAVGRPLPQSTNGLAAPAKKPQNNHWPAFFFFFSNGLKPTSEKGRPGSGGQLDRNCFLKNINRKNNQLSRTSFSSVSSVFLFESRKRERFCRRHFPPKTQLLAP